MSEDTTITQSSRTTAASSSNGAPAAPSNGKRKVKSLKSCNVCGRGFIKLAHLIRHARTHGNERPFSCTKCDKAFARTDALQRHERAVHSGVNANANRDVDDTGLLGGSPASSSVSDEENGELDRDSSRDSHLLRSVDGVTGRSSGSNKKRKANGEARPSLTRSETSSNTPQSQKSQAEESNNNNNIFHPDFRILLGLDEASNSGSHHHQQQHQQPIQANLPNAYPAAPAVHVRQESSTSSNNDSRHLQYPPSHTFGVPGQCPTCYPALLYCELRAD